MNIILSLIGKILSFLINKLSLGSGGTWPGHIALKLNKNFIKQTMSNKTKIVLIAGTNGKTTTATLVSHILQESGFSFGHNKSGANQLNGLSSTLISEISIFSNK